MTQYDTTLFLFAFSILTLMGAGVFGAVLYTVCMAVRDAIMRAH